MCAGIAFFVSSAVEFSHRAGTSIVLLITGGVAAWGLEFGHRSGGNIVGVRKLTNRGEGLVLLLVVLYSGGGNYIRLSSSI